MIPGSQSKSFWIGILLAALGVSLVAGIWIWMRKKRLTCKGTCWGRVPGGAGLAGLWAASGSLAWTMDHPGQRPRNSSAEGGALCVARKEGQWTAGVARASET